MATSKNIENELEDYVWGNVKEQDYLERVIKNKGLGSDAILRKVSQIDDTLNRQLRKGVEENLTRLLEQTTALEALDKTQRNVHVEMNDVFDNCDKFANNLDSLLVEYKRHMNHMKKLTAVSNLTSDALRCEELMESFDKRSESVKRSEIICEVKGIVEDNPDLLKVQWLRETLTVRLKAAENEVRRAAADDLRRALVSLNATLVASAARALGNLGVLEAELEVQLSSSASEVDTKLSELSTTQQDSSRMLPATVNLIHSHIEQCALLGQRHMNKFTEKLARIIRARVPLDASFALRFVQQMGRVLQSRPECSLGPLSDALRPLKNGLLSHSLAKLHKMIEDHDFHSLHANAFVDLLNGTIEEERRRVEWDVELREEMEKNVRRSLDMVAKKLESVVQLESENLLLGDRLGAAQVANYRLLQCAHGLAAKWPTHSESLVQFQSESVSTILSAVQQSVTKIMASMQTEKLGNRETSPYLQELVDYVDRIKLHVSHFSGVVSQTDALSHLVDHILDQFLLNATIIRPCDDVIRQQLHIDLNRLLTALADLAPSFRYPSASVVSLIFAKGVDEVVDEIRHGVPAWVLLHLLIADSPPALISPHISVQWTAEAYVGWCTEHTEMEILAFLNSLMTSYTNSVISKGEAEYVHHYPKIMQIIQHSMDA